MPRMGWFGGGADPFVRCVAGKPDWLVHGEGGSMFAVSSGSLCMLPSCIVQAVGAGEQPLQDHRQGKLCLLGEGWAASSRSTFGSGAVHARPAVCVICCPVTGRPCTHPLLPCCRPQSRTLSPEWRESFTLIVHSTRYQTLTLVLFDSGGQAGRLGLWVCRCHRLQQERPSGQHAIVHRRTRSGPHANQSALYTCTACRQPAAGRGDWAG